MNQDFENDNYLFSVFDQEDPLLKISYSRNEQYALYKGLNRTDKYAPNHQFYSKTFRNNKKT